MKDVRSSLYANFATEGWVGSESSHISEKLKNLREYRKAESNRKVLNWVDDYIRGLEKDLKRAEIEEERMGY